MGKHLAGFLDFVRKQGVVGLAVGFLLGGAVSKLVTALVADIINPFMGLFLWSAQNLKDVKFEFHGSVFLWGDFLAMLIDFLIISAVVYFGVRGLGLDKMDKKEEK